jgi:hypothetical protein
MQRPECRRCDQRLLGITAETWLPSWLPALDRISKNRVGRTGFEPVTSSVSVQGSCLLAVVDLAMDGSGGRPGWVLVRRRCCHFCCHASCQSSLGYEPADVRLRRLGQSPVTALALADSAARGRFRPLASPPTRAVPPRPVYKSVYRTGY